MFGGAIPLLAKIALPLVGSAIKSLVQSATAPEAPPAARLASSPSIEQMVAGRFDVTKLSVNEMKQMADTLYDAGKLSVEEYGILTSMPLSVMKNDLGGIELQAFKGENSSQHDFIKNLELSLQARQAYGLDKGYEASLSLLNKLKAMNVMHEAPLATSA